MVHTPGARARARERAFAFQVPGHPTHGRERGEQPPQRAAGPAHAYRPGHPGDAAQRVQVCPAAPRLPAVAPDGIPSLFPRPQEQVWREFGRRHAVQHRPAAGHALQQRAGDSSGWAERRAPGGRPDCPSGHQPQAGQGSDRRGRRQRGRRSYCQGGGGTYDCPETYAGGGDAVQQGRYVPVFAAGAQHV